MKIDRKLKLKIVEDWLAVFPQLSVYGSNKLYKVVGCSILGIELIKLPYFESYRPHLVIYALWKMDLKSCLDAPMLMMPLSNNKGVLFDIPYLKHDTYFSEAIGCFKRRFLVSMGGDVRLKSLFNLVDQAFDDILIKSNSAQQAKLLSLEFYLSLYTGRQTGDILNLIKDMSKNWNMEMFESWYGKFDLWYQKLENEVNQRDAFLGNIEVNKQTKKIVKLQCSQLIL